MEKEETERQIQIAESRQRLRDLEAELAEAELAEAEAKERVDALYEEIRRTAKPGRA